MIGGISGAVMGVVPHAGTWIEIPIVLHAFGVKTLASFPTRERGLKWHYSTSLSNVSRVVPHAGTWIEIMVHTPLQIKLLSRSPRGNVD